MHMLPLWARSPPLPSGAAVDGLCELFVLEAVVAVLQLELREQVIRLLLRDRRTDVLGGQGVLAVCNRLEGREERVFAVVVFVLLEHEGGEAAQVDGHRRRLLGTLPLLGEPEEGRLLLVVCNLEVHRLDGGRKLELVEQPIFGLVEVVEDLLDLLVLLARNLRLSARELPLDKGPLVAQHLVEEVDLRLERHDRLRRVRIVELRGLHQLVGQLLGRQQLRVAPLLGVRRHQRVQRIPHRLALLDRRRVVGLDDQAWRRNLVQLGALRLDELEDRVRRRRKRLLGRVDLLLVRQRLLHRHLPRLERRFAPAHMREEVLHAEPRVRVARDLHRAHLLGVGGDGVEVTLQRLERLAVAVDLGHLLLGLGDGVDHKDLAERVHLLLHRAVERLGLFGEDEPHLVHLLLVRILVAQPLLRLGAERLEVLDALLDHGRAVRQRELAHWWAAELADLCEQLVELRHGRLPPT
mmetsp:Transcript_30159/g.94234  ORF Transcript_30159/g.94234 Transcript_30159/m.94234 type:complete len:466 (-) Transcript_30159:24-1421(-)